jgi:putative flippase GtrA
MAIKDSTKFRYVIVGSTNTVLDFGILFTLSTLGLPAITSNIISTSIAFCFSFFANKKYTFKTTDTNVKREIFLFVVVTLFGIWVLQTIIISLVGASIVSLHLSSELTLLAAKLCASVITLAWNYLMYSRVVFKQA